MNEYLVRRFKNPVALDLSVRREKANPNASFLEVVHQSETAQQNQEHICEEDDGPIASGGPHGWGNR